jgi:MinD superfamily P-loop ATPase
MTLIPVFFLIPIRRNQPRNCKFMPEIPVLNENRCTGCGDCVRVCPVDCLEMLGSIPWLPRPQDCLSCELCVLVCPVDALQLRDMEPA